MHACMYVCMYACMHARMHLCMYVPPSSFTHSQRLHKSLGIANVCMYVCTYVRTYVCMYVRTYVCMYVYVCVVYSIGYSGPDISEQLLFVNKSKFLLILIILTNSQTI